MSDLPTSTHYWASLLGMKVLGKDEEKRTILMGYEDQQASQNEYVVSEKYINIVVTNPWIKWKHCVCVCVCVCLCLCLCLV